MAEAMPAFSSYRCDTTPAQRVELAVTSSKCAPTRRDLGADSLKGPSESWQATVPPAGHSL